MPCCSERIVRDCSPYPRDGHAIRNAALSSHGQALLGTMLGADTRCIRDSDTHARGALQAPTLEQPGWNINRWPPPHIPLWPAHTAAVPLPEKRRILIARHHPASLRPSTARHAIGIAVKAKAIWALTPSTAWRNAPGGAAATH